jgi:[ribosomal protein S5]-alanine N-acetyltransferase
LRREPTRSTLDRVQTERMVGERLRADHAAELVTLLQDPRVWPTLWAADRAPSEREVEVWLEGALEHWERHGFGLWLLCDRISGEMMGRGGLEYTTASGALEVEVAWAIVPERWGQGLATELAHASLSTAFEVLDLDQVIALTLPHNVASRRVMEKARFAYERDIVHAGLPHVLYRRSRDIYG